MIPFDHLVVHTALDGESVKTRLTGTLLDANIYWFRVSTRSPLKLKGRWHGSGLVVVRPQENFWIAGNVLLIRPSQVGTSACVRVWMVGNIFVTLLFLVVILQWVLLGIRLGMSLYDGSPSSMSDVLGMDHFSNSPLLHVLATSGFYFTLYLNLVRKGLLHWRKLLPAMFQ